MSELEADASPEDKRAPGAQGDAGGGAPDARGGSGGGAPDARAGGGDGAPPPRGSPRATRTRRAPAAAAGGGAPEVDDELASAIRMTLETESLEREQPAARARPTRRLREGAHARARRSLDGSTGREDATRARASQFFLPCARRRLRHADECAVFNCFRARALPRACVPREQRRARTEVP